MIRQSTLIGSSVIDSNGQHMLGKVRSFAVCLEDSALSGMVYATNGIIKRSMFVPCQRITQIESGFITIDKPLKSIKHPKCTMDISKRLEVVDQNGNELGFVMDFFIDEHDCRIDSLEVSKGVFEDVVCGRFIVKEFSRMEYSEKIIAAFNDKIIQKEG